MRGEWFGGFGVWLSGWVASEVDVEFEAALFGVDRVSLGVLDRPRLREGVADPRAAVQCVRYMCDGCVFQIDAELIGIGNLDNAAIEGDPAFAELCEGGIAGVGIGRVDASEGFDNGDGGGAGLDLGVRDEHRTGAGLFRGGLFVARLRGGEGDKG